MTPGLLNLPNDFSAFFELVHVTGGKITDNFLENKNVTF